MTQEQTKYNHILPMYWPVYPLLSVLGYYIYSSSIWPLAILFYITTWSVSPFADWRIWFRLVRRSLSGRYGDLPLRFNLVGLAPLLWFALVQWPLETCLWYLDELFFAAYSQTRVREPLFLVGQPRSGTTKFQEVLAADKEEFCSMLLWEMRFPYLSVQYLVDAACKMDQILLGGRGRQWVTKAGLMNSIPQGKELQRMRRMQYDLVDEDDVIFCFHGLFHLTLLAMFPDERLVPLFYQMSELPPETRRRYMEFHQRAVQKMMYRRGDDRRYLCKWVTGWNGLLEESSHLYPDAKYVVIARDPRDQLPSWMKLQGLLAEPISGINTIRDFPAIREAVLTINTKWYLKQHDFCLEQSKDPQRAKSNSMMLVSFDEFVKDIPGQIGNVYAFLNQTIRPTYQEFLLLQRQRQTQHKRTIILKEETVVNEETIEDFVQISLWNKIKHDSSEQVPQLVLSEDEESDKED